VISKGDEYNKSSYLFNYLYSTRPLYFMYILSTLLYILR